MRQAVDTALLRRHEARVTVTPTRLVLRGWGYVLTYVSDGPSTHGNEPSEAQTSRTSGAK